MPELIYCYTDEDGELFWDTDPENLTLNFGVETSSLRIFNLGSEITEETSEECE